ncbi:MAG: septum formation protein Maf [Marinomonas atlantica]|nr:septum formation protein Maf [Marinomonas atlantica]
MTQKLILGSSSKYRQNLLNRLGLAFTTLTPNIDESRLDNEAPEQYIERITKAKALALYSTLDNNSILITSDQCATYNGSIIGKPHTRNNAIEQLRRFSGQKVEFLTGLYVVNTFNQLNRYSISTYSVIFRNLTEHEIQNYIDIDSPLDCAGSFKCESLGVALFEQMEGCDPSSLEGLPLIETCNSLRAVGLNPLA